MRQIVATMNRPGNPGDSKYREYGVMSSLARCFPEFHKGADINPETQVLLAPYSLYGVGPANAISHYHSNFEPRIKPSPDYPDKKHAFIRTGAEIH